MDTIQSMGEMIPNVDVTALNPTHQGKWVAMSLKTREIYAVGSDPKTVMEEAKQKGCFDPVLQKVPPVDHGLMPHA